VLKKTAVETTLARVIRPLSGFVSFNPEDLRRFLVLGKRQRARICAQAASVAEPKRRSGEGALMRAQLSGGRVCVPADTIAATTVS
jgi:hypothetical protein